MRRPASSTARGARRHSSPRREDTRGDTRGDSRGTLRLRMPSRRDAVAPTVERVLDAVRPAGLTTEQRDDLAVALAEALANAAVHGNRLRHERQVRISVSIAPDRCVAIQISDSGPGFDHAQVHDPTHPERVLATGGRGVFLMRRLVDELEYNEEGNTVRLTVRPRRG